MRLFAAIQRGALLLALLCAAAGAQTVSPIIVEFQEKGDGKILLTNTTLTPEVVVVEAQSFSIARDGSAIYRALDPGIHVDLSANSVRLAPNQSYYVFYKAHADRLPAWFTIYASFSQVKRASGINLRIMLPHTVYLYQKKSLDKSQVQVTQAFYLADKKMVVFDVENTGTAYGRMREGTVQAPHDSATVNGFPLLPGNPRHLEIPWTGSKQPQTLVLRFDHFEIKTPLGPGPPGLAMAGK